LSDTGHAAVKASARKPEHTRTPFFPAAAERAARARRPPPAARSVELARRTRAVKENKRRMAHILRRLGEAALQFRRLDCGKVLPPILSRRKAMMLRRDVLADGR